MRSADFGDERLNRRAGIVLAQLAEKPEESIPGCCGGWAETQAAYRFFNNEKVTPEGILAPHQEATLGRILEHPVVLCVQDTTELDFTGAKIEGLGPLGYELTLGLYVHPTLAVTPERLCLGTVALWTWARDPQTHGTTNRKNRLHRPLEQKESFRWVEGYRKVCALQEKVWALQPEEACKTRLVCVADRESDLFELFVAGNSGSAAWLIRANHPRTLEGGDKLLASVQVSASLGEIAFDLPQRGAHPARRVVQTLRTLRVRLRPPLRPDTKLEALDVTAVLAQEQDPPEGVEPIQWLLLTNLPVETFEQASEKIQWYLCRWQIEVYFRVLKSGCKVESLQLQARGRLEAALALYMIVAWRVLYLTMAGRVVPDLSCAAVFSPAEWRAIYLVTRKKQPPQTPPRLEEMLRMVARLGGHLGRKDDGPPGPKAIWKGLKRTRDFVIALEARESSA
jgi:hypothetical protein